MAQVPVRPASTLRLGIVRPRAEVLIAGLAFILTGCSRMAAMILGCPPPRFGQVWMSMSQTRSSSRAQLMGCGRAWTVSTPHSAAGTSCAAGPCGTTREHSWAIGTSTRWFAQRGSAHLAQRSCADTYLIRCGFYRGTSAASRCMNSGGLITRCVVPSRHGVLSLSSTRPAGLSWIRSSDSARQVM